MSGAEERRCRLWEVARADGLVLGFTDHDGDLEAGGVVFRARGGLSAGAVQQATGLALDNSEAAGVLSDAGLAEADLAAGRWDGAGVRIWEADWAAPGARRLVFAGRLGEIARAGGAFRAELRGLAEALGQPRGRVIAGRCGAVLGDAACRFDLGLPGYRVEAEALAVAEEGAEVVLPALPGVLEGWFVHGALEVLTGAAAGLRTTVKAERAGEAGRVIVLWQGLAGLEAGDVVRVAAGCDRRLGTCRAKFANAVNFRGFPDVPGEDWLVAVPREGGRHDGGSRRG